MSEKRPFWHDLVDSPREAPVAAPQPVPAPTPNPFDLPVSSRHIYNTKLSKNEFSLQINASKFQDLLVYQGFNPEQIRSIIQVLEVSLCPVELTANPELNNTVAAQSTNSPKNETQAKPLPETAPELYKGRTNTSEDGPAFYNRVYKDHIGNGLTRAVLDKLDHPLVARIDALKRKGDAAALALDLPTAWVAPQQWAKRVLAGEETLPTVADASTLSRHAARLARERKRQAGPQK